MPYYDYNCADCGPFTETRPMAASAEPCDCPSCGTAAPRAFFTTPFFSLFQPMMRSQGCLLPALIFLLMLSMGKYCGCGRL